MSCFRRAHLIFLTVLLTLLGAAVPAFGQKSPTGVVDDQSNRLSATQLERLDQGLSGKRFAYRVLIVEKAFPEENPSDKEARFSALTAQWVEELQLPDDAVLIAVAMEERLVDFRVWEDGAVNATYRQETGRAFGDHSSIFLAAFREPAGSGDIPGGILAAVEAMEVAVAKSPGNTTSPTPPPVSTVPPVTSAPPVSTRPGDGSSAVPVAASPVTEGSPVIWWWLLSGAGGVGGIAWTAQGVGYRRRRRETLAVRDRFLGDLLGMMQRDIPLARNYDGDETRRHAQEAVAYSERALQVQQTGEEQRKEAERRAGLLRFISASQMMHRARLAYEEAADAFGKARQAYAPILEAVQEYDVALAGARNEERKAKQSLSAAQTETAWSLPVLVGRLEAQATTLKQAEADRQEDPVRALRLVREATSGCQDVSSSLETLSALRTQYAEQQRSRMAAEGEVENARRTLGLRFVEQNPNESLARALAQEQAMVQRMPEGDVPGAEAALQAAVSAVREALGIVEAYRKALAEYPGKMAQLARELDATEGEAEVARRVLGDLAQRYAAEDWADLEPLPGAMSTLLGNARPGLDKVTELTSPAEQRYLQAVSLLDSWLGEREALRTQHLTLLGRPDQLAQLAEQASARLAQAVESLRAALSVVSRHGLRLQPQFERQREQVEGEVAGAHRLGEQRPLPANRWARVAGEAADRAAAFYQAMEDLARQAAEARRQLEHARHAAHRALSYESYDRSGASSMRHALSAAEFAVSDGRYDEALAMAGQAIHFAHVVERAYRAYVEEQERQRREEERRRREEEERRRQSSRTSGGGGSWGSSSKGNRTSGGGGSW